MKEINEQAPSIWKEMMAAHSETDFFERLPNEKKMAITRWEGKRSILLQDMTRKEVDAELECHSSLNRSSIPFIRVCVKSYRRWRPGLAQKMFDDNERSCGAILTVHRVTEEQLNLLKEGSVIRLKNIKVKPNLQHGLLQLTLMSSSQLQAVLPQPSPEETRLSGYTKRSYLSIAKTHVLSRKLSHGFLIAPEVDVVGSIFKSQRDCRRTPVKVQVYLTDESVSYRGFRSDGCDTNNIYVLFLLF